MIIIIFLFIIIYIFLVVLKHGLITKKLRMTKRAVSNSFEKKEITWRQRPENW